MRILLPYRISRKFIQSHPEWIFVYGSDYLNKSFFGQAYCAANEPNSYPVPTIWKICPSSGEHFMDDGYYDLFKTMIDKRISEIPNDGRPILPFKKIGEGHSEMNKRAPLLFNYLRDALAVLAYEHIEIDYKGLVYPLYNVQSSS